MIVTRIVCGFMLLAQSASAQPGRRAQTGPQKNAAIKEVGEVLDRAKSGQAENISRALEQASNSRRIEALGARAAKNPDNAPGAAEKALQVLADPKLAAALNAVSAPEGKSLLAQSAAAAPTRGPGPREAIPVAGIVPAAAPPQVTDAKPKPLKPVPLNPPVKKEPARTVITSEGAAFFDSKQAMGVFTEDVVVNHPQFHLTCEVLEVYMHKQAADKEEGASGANAKAEGAPEAPAVRPAGVLPGETPPPKPDNNIRQAIGKGPKVVIQKLSESGEAQIGICRHATYVGATGDIIMRDYPQVQRGRNVVIATDASTVMTIKQNGQFTSKGPTRTDIIQEKQKNIAPAPKPLTDASAAVAPAAPKKAPASP